METGTGTVMAICISERRGTKKSRVSRARLIADFGIEADAHAGNWHRQVSLLAYETIEAFKAKGADVQDGDFGENIVVQGIDLIRLPVGTRLCCNNILMEVTQIGKECHAHCEIYYSMGECIMPSNGIFAKVLHGGILKTGDEINVCTG